MTSELFWFAYLYLMGGVLMYILLTFMNRLAGNMDPPVYVVGALLWPLIVPLWMIVIIVRGADK